MCRMVEKLLPTKELNQDTMENVNVAGKSQLKVSKYSAPKAMSGSMSDSDSKRSKEL